MVEGRDPQTVNRRWGVHGSNLLRANRDGSISPLLALKLTEGLKMSIEPEGWYMDAGPPSWDAEAKTFSFFLCKSGCDRVLCVLAIDALENAAQSSDLSEPAMTRIFDAHRLLIELRAAQKVNAGLLDSNGSVLLGADDI
jgi:hypothetical protein